VTRSERWGCRDGSALRPHSQEQRIRQPRVDIETEPYDLESRLLRQQRAQAFEPKAQHPLGIELAGLGRDLGRADDFDVDNIAVRVPGDGKISSQRIESLRTSGHAV